MSKEEKKERKRVALEEAYRKLKTAASIKVTYIPDRIGTEAVHNIKWDKPTVLNILEDMLEEIK